MMIIEVVVIWIKTHMRTRADDEAYDGICI